MPISLDEFKALIAEAEVTCKLCGYRAHSLSRHLREMHKLSIGQYKEKFPADQHPDAKVVSSLVIDVLKRFPKAAFEEEESLDTISANLGLAKMAQEGKFIELGQKMPKLDPKLTAGFEVPIENPEYQFPEEILKGLTAGLVLRKNIFVSGPSGCGKTEGVMQLFARMKRPLLRANMNGDMTAAKFIGTNRVKAGVGTYFHYGMLPLAMKAGVPILMDEIDYTPPQIATVMNPVLEGKRMLYLEETGETIHALDGFQIIATGNTSGKGDRSGAYSGTEILNTAFLDRFPIKLNADYMPSTEEVALLQKRGLAEAQSLVNVAVKVREAFKNQTLSITLTTRKLLDFADLRKVGYTSREAMEVVLLNWLDKDDAPAVEAMVSQTWPQLVSKTTTSRNGKK